MSEIEKQPCLAKFLAELLISHSVHTHVKHTALQKPAIVSQPQPHTEKATVSRCVECVESGILHVSRSQEMLCLSKTRGKTAQVII